MKYKNEMLRYILRYKHRVNCSTIINLRRKVTEFINRIESSKYVFSSFQKGTAAFIILLLLTHRNRISIVV